MVEEVQVYVDSVESGRPLSDEKLEEIRAATADDPLFQEVMHFTRFGWPEHCRSLKENCRDFFASRSELSISDGLLLYRDRIAIPEELRPEIMEKIHEGHQGINKCRARANMCVWWPGLANDIRLKITTCEFFQIHKPAQKREPLKSTPLPARPWQKVAADLCELDGKQYLVVTDYFSRYLEIAHLPTITSDQVIGKLKNIFARWGVPEEFVSDNGKQFVSESFRTFAKAYNFRQTFSSPHYPQSNGEAESAVKIAKMILQQNDIFLALMAYRSTPIDATGMSPAQLIMGRQLRTNMPSMSSVLEPKWPDRETVEQKDADRKVSSQTYYNTRYGAYPLPELRPGDTVRIKTDKENKWTSHGTIMSTDPDIRTYVVKTPNGPLRRNRRHLQSVPFVRPQRTFVPFDDPYPTSATGSDVPVDVRSEIMTETPTSQNIAPVPEPSVPDQLTTRSGRIVKRPKRFDDSV